MGFLTILKRISSVLKINIRLFFVFMYNPQKYYDFLEDFKYRNVLRNVLRVIVYSIIIFIGYLCLLIIPIFYLFNKNFMNIVIKTIFYEKGSIKIFFLLFLIVIFYLSIFNVSFNVSFKAKGKVVHSILKVIIINLYPALFFSLGLYLLMFYGNYRFNGYITVSIIISIMVSDAIKYLINMTSYNKIRIVNSDSINYYRCKRNIKALSKFLLVIGIISFLLINIVHQFIYIKYFRVWLLFVISIVLTSRFLLIGFMNIVYTLLIILLTVSLKFNKVNDIILRNLPLCLNSIYDSIKIGRFDAVYNLLNAVAKISYDDAIKVVFDVMNNGLDKSASVKFLSNEVKNKNIDSVMIAIHQYGISKDDFQRLLNGLDGVNKKIFENIHDLYNITKIKNAEELIRQIKTIQYSLNKIYPKTQYAKLLRSYIDLMSINRIEMFSNFELISCKYDISLFYRNLFKCLVNISTVIKEYLNIQVSKEDRLMSLKKANNILEKLKREIYNTKDYPSKRLFVNIISNYSYITMREVYLFSHRAIIDLKVLSNKVYYSRKDKVSIPFVILNKGYVDARKLIITSMNNKGNYDFNEKKYKIYELNVDEYKNLNIDIKIKEPGPIELFIMVLYVSGGVYKYRDAFKFTIIAESNGRKYISVEDNFITGMVVYDESKFIGRKEYIKAINYSIRSTSIIIQGNRRVGKTSLLYRIKDGVLGKGIHTIFFDMQQLSIYNHSLDLLKYMVDKIYDYLIENGFELEFSNYKKDNLDYKDINKIFEKINKILGKDILLLLIDEFEFFEKFIKDSDDLFKNLWRSILISYSNIRYIFSGFLNLSKYSFWSEIEMVTKPIQLGKFTFIEAKNLFDIYLGDNVIIEDSALNKIYEATGGHPYLLQCLGSNIVSYVNSIKEPYVLLEDVDEIKKKFLVSNDSFFKWLWYSLMSDIERDEIIKILKENDPSEPIIKLAKDTDKIKLDSLSAEKQIINIYNNQIEFVIPLFKDWIKMKFIM